jgi:hypothetical protein
MNGLAAVGAMPPAAVELRRTRLFLGDGEVLVGHVVRQPQLTLVATIQDGAIPKRLSKTDPYQGRPTVILVSSTERSKQDFLGAFVDHEPRIA